MHFSSPASGTCITVIVYLPVTCSYVKTYHCEQYTTLIVINYFYKCTSEAWLIGTSQCIQTSLSPLFWYQETRAAVHWSVMLFLFKLCWRLSTTSHSSVSPATRSLDGATNSTRKYSTWMAQNSKLGSVYKIGSLHKEDAPFHNFWIL